jgi:hypothetical protein
MINIFKRKQANQLYVYKHKIKRLINDLKQLEDEKINKTLVCLRLKDIIK